MTNNVYEETSFTKGEADKQDRAKSEVAAGPPVVPVHTPAASFGGFLGTYSAIQRWVGKVNRANGWKRNKELLMEVVDGRGNEKLSAYARHIIAGNELALITSEASECLEGLRNSEGKSEHIEEFTNEEEEIADIVIRCMDYADERGLRIAEAILAKVAFNGTRGENHGGKLA